jgi:two-component system, NtrC family, response regulator AtoC
MSQPRPFVPDDELIHGLLRRLDERACLPRQLLEQLVLGSLPAAEAVEVGAHVKDCLSCLSTFSRLQGLHESSEPRTGLIVDSPSTRRLRQDLTRLARMEDGPGAAAPPVLVAGESGTGKGVVAWEIHALSRRGARAFIEVHCTAGPAFRLELELFGYERGTAPDVTGAAPGLFEAADGGTLFLHDVDALSLDLQGKLLAAIESKSVRRLGGVAARSLDVRVIAATHADLADAVRRGSFRADLLDRFARSTLTLLPLRERPDDILPLARHFAARFSQRHGEARQLTSDAEEQLRRYRWPGNVRELSDVIARAVMRRGRKEIGAEELGLPSM